jgi:pentatricopeptide repeat protein
MEWIKHKSPSQLRSMWQEDFTETMRVKAWLELMITMLELHPTKALGVLDATFIKPYPPSYAVMDSLNYLIDHYFRNQQDYPSEYIDHLSETLFRILVEGPRKQLSLSQHSIKLVMSGLDHSQRERFYEVLVQIGHPMKENTLIHFSDQFARNGHTDLAFEVMQRLKNSTFNTPAMLSLCSTLLHRANRDPNALSTETAIFKFMVDCGMTPNVITHNILIRNAIEDGDHQTAWQIHDMMKDAGIEPDDFTYSILLNDAKKRMDATDIGRVMSIVREGRMRSPHIATDVLHAILLLYQKNVEEGLEDETGADSKTAFTHMLPVYCEYFQLKPLARIIHAFSKNYPEAAGLQLEAEQTFFPPSQEPLVIMITAYLSAIKDPRSARKFYDHFRTLVYAGNPAVQELVTTTRIWNFILFTFGRFPELMADCANLIGDMMSPVEKEVLVTPESDVITHKKFVHRSFVPPKPDVYTWSILLKIFTDQNQTRAAEKVISMMEERDIKPNIITWNTLINSYAEMQDIDMAADTIGRLEDAGLTADSVTFRTIYKIHNRSAFMRTLQDRRRRSPPTWSTATEEQLKEDLEAHVQSESEAATQEDSLAREKLVNVNEDEDTQPQPGIQIRKVLSLNGSIGPSALQAALARK